MRQRHDAPLKRFAPMTRKDVARIRRRYERELEEERKGKSGLRRTFVNIGKVLLERHALQDKERTVKNTWASWTKTLGMSLATLCLLSTLGFVGHAALMTKRPELAKLSKASPQDSEKAIAASKRLLEAMEVSPERLRNLCPRLDDEKALDLRGCLERAGMPLFEQATASVPKFDPALCYVSVPASGGMRLHLAFRKIKSDMSVEGFSVNR